MTKLLVLLAVPALLLAGPALRLQDEMPVVTKELVDHVNAQGRWKASLDWAGDMTVGQAKRMLGALPSQKKVRVEKFGALKDYMQTPPNFDSRTQWPLCTTISTIRNQAQCGSCWAFSATEVLEDRFCVDKGVIVVLAPQWLVSCDTNCHGCAGGDMGEVWDYLASTGIPLETNAPYISGDNDETGECPSDVTEFYTAKAPTGYVDPTAIQIAVLQGGPVQAQFNVYQDFYSYRSGIYEHTSGNLMGAHDVKIVGWGDQNGVNYWIIANSWGNNWGSLGGFFWIGFGQCGIDTYAIAGSAGTIPS